MSHVFNPEKDQIFKPRFKNKYTGKEFPICRSSWERSFCKFCDLNDNVVAWNSEPIGIPYYDPIKKKDRRYFPDFLVKINNKDGNEKVFMIEIKPEKELQLPKSRNKKTRLRETMTLSNNMAKWNAANNLCKRKGWEFKIVTENDLFRK